MYEAEIRGRPKGSGLGHVSDGVQLDLERQVAELRDDSDFGARARDTILGMLSAAALGGAELQAARDLGVHAVSAATVDDGASAADVGQAQGQPASAQEVPRVTLENGSC